MTIQLSIDVRNARLGAYKSTIGASPILRMYSGALPANCAAAATGVKLVEAVLPSVAFGDPANGTLAKAGAWQDLAADAGGTLGYYRIYDGSGATCHEQGAITVTGGGGDMTVDNTSVAQNQQVTVTSFTRTDANA